MGLIANGKQRKILKGKTFGTLTPPGKEFSLHKIYCIQKGGGGSDQIQRIANFILCDTYLVASRLCMGKAYLKIRNHRRGLGKRKGCVMNMRDMLHEYGAPMS